MGSGCEGDEGGSNIPLPETFYAIASSFSVINITQKDFLMIYSDQNLRGGVFVSLHCPSTTLELGHWDEDATHILREHRLTQSRAVSFYAPVRVMQTEGFMRCRSTKHRGGKKNLKFY